MKQLYDEKTRRLVLLSDISNSYPRLKAFLESMKNPTAKDLGDYDEDVRRIFENKLFPDIVLQARAEWFLREGGANPQIIMSPLKEKRQCQYCDQPNLKYIYFIENKYNQNVLEVGSTCVIDLGIKSKKEMGDIESNAKKLHRLTRLNDIIPGVADLVENSSDITDSCDILVAEAVSRGYLENSKKLNECFNRYIDLSTPEKKLPLVEAELKQLLGKHRELGVEIRKYIELHHQDLLVAKKSYLSFVQKMPEANKQMQKAGTIGKLAILHIADEEFMHRLVPKLNQLLLPYDIDIQGISRRHYEYVAPERRETFYVAHDKLVGFIAEGIYDEPLTVQFEQKDILAESILADDKSINIAIAWLANHTVYDFDFNRTLNEIIFYPRKNRDTVFNSKGNTPNSLLHKWDAFYRRYARVLLTREEFDKKELVAYIYSGEKIVFVHHQEMGKEMERMPSRSR